MLHSLGMPHVGGLKLDYCIIVDQIWNVLVQMLRPNIRVFVSTHSLALWALPGACATAASRASNSDLSLELLTHSVRKTHQRSNTCALLHFMAAVQEMKHAFVCRPRVSSNYRSLPHKVYYKHYHSRLFSVYLLSHGETNKEKQIDFLSIVWEWERATGAVQRLEACRTSSSCLLSSVQPLRCGAQQHSLVSAACVWVLRQRTDRRTTSSRKREWVNEWAHSSSFSFAFNFLKEKCWISIKTFLSMPHKYKDLNTSEKQLMRMYLLCYLYLCEFFF